MGFRTAICFLLISLATACQPLPRAPSSPPVPLASPEVSPGAASSAPPTPPAARLDLSVGRWADLPGWSDDNVAAAIPPFLRSCRIIAAKPPDTPLGVAGNASDWRGPCREAASLPVGDIAAARQFFLRDFLPVAATDRGDADGLFTGYYEAALNGRLSPDQRFSVPLYRRPADLISVDLGQFRPALMGQKIAGRVENGRLIPYADRAAIMGGALSGRGLELIYTDSAADAFFLAVQGSGRVRLTDGRVMRIGYDGENGWPYVSIGKVLRQRGIPADQINLPFLRRWLLEHPDQAAALMNSNPSYIFFREISGPGPLGSQGTVLTPERSAAVDRRFIPLGVPIWVDTSDPVLPGGRLRRLLIAQDTGGAISGPVRADIFFGFGAVAEMHAGLMKGRGRWWLLLPKSIAARLIPVPGS